MEGGIPFRGTVILRTTSTSSTHLLCLTCNMEDANDGSVEVGVVVVVVAGMVAQGW
jgi:hypothetical protein